MVSVTKTTSRRPKTECRAGTDVDASFRFVTATAATSIIAKLFPWHRLYRLERSGWGGPATECPGERTPSQSVGGSLTVIPQHFPRFCSQLAADFSPPALRPCDAHLVVSRRLVTHPRNDGGFGPLPDRNPAGTSDRAAAHRCCMLGNRDGHPSSDSRIPLVEIQKVQDGAGKFLDVRLLFFVAATTGSGQLFLIAGGLAFGVHCLLGRGDLPAVGPQALRKFSASASLLHGPRRPRRFDLPRQPGITRRQQFPAGGNLGHLA